MIDSTEAMATVLAYEIVIVAAVVVMFAAVLSTVMYITRGD